MIIGVFILRNTLAFCRFLKRRPELPIDIIIQILSKAPSPKLCLAITRLNRWLNAWGLEQIRKRAAQDPAYLLEAIRCDHRTGVKAALEGGAVVRTLLTTPHPLIVACNRRRSTVIDLLLNHPSWQLQPANHKEDWLCHALNRAILSRNGRACELLIPNFQGPVVQLPDWNMTVEARALTCDHLILAARHKLKNVVSLIHARGVQLNNHGLLETSAIYLVRDDPDMVRFLLSKGAHLRGLYSSTSKEVVTVEQERRLLQKWLYDCPAMTVAWKVLGGLYYTAAVVLAVLGVQEARRPPRPPRKRGIEVILWL